MISNFLNLQYKERFESFANYRFLQMECNIMHTINSHCCKAEKKSKAEAKAEAKLKLDAYAAV